MIYLDTNVIVYAIENHPKYGKKCKQILEDIASEKLKAHCSVLVLAELINVLTRLNRILRERREKALDIRHNIDAVLSLPITWVDLNFAVIRRASEYDYATAGADYVHVATMELDSITKVISADADFDHVEFIKRIDPLGYK
ncbi:MAG: type II toxin-antitoxin system VapC family toxin [Candidatus Aenigmarchaeota archaeon]|nr:type II toxin-antitoxin system VapC family toxin [Candidatus Aenigmarchaeota archaeon]